MASFTDQLTQFTPYIQQLPAEEMVQVGMYKQAQYDQGVQKIQGYIDNIAGMDVVKPVHKQYLQSKLNELGSKLKTVAAGDFSNQQLVNSVGGMATQIIKDPVVQTAVSSTQRFRNEQERIKAARKAGKSSVDNEDYFADQFNTWMNDANVNTPFTGEYIEYKDVDSKLRELTGKLKEDELQFENPYMRDEQGRTLYFSTDPKTNKVTASLDPSQGEKRLDLDMLSVKTKGISAQRILNNFYNSLDSDDVRQLKINSWAHYRGRGPAYFKADIEAAYEDKKQMLSEQKVDLAVRLQDPRITGVQKAKLEADLSDINAKIENKELDKELANDLMELENPRNLDEFKYKLYTQTHLTNMARDLANKSYIQERKTNPAEQADMARKRFQLDQIKEANEMYRWKVSENRLERTLQHTIQQDELKTIGQGYRVTPGDWKTGQAPPTITDLEKDVAASGDSYIAAQNKFAERLFPSSDSRFKSMTLGEKRKALDKLSSDYRQNPNMTLTPDQADYLEQNRQASNDITQKINLLTAARQYEVDAKAKKVKETVGDATVTVKGVTYTGDDVVDFNSNINKFNKSRVALSAKGSPTTSYYFDEDEALNFYKTFKGGKLLPMAQAYIKDKSLTGRTTTEDEQLLKFSKKVGFAAKDIDAATAEEVSRFISKSSPVYAVQRAAINVADPLKAKDLDDFLATKAAQYNQKGGLDVNEKKQYNPATTAKIRGDKNANVVIEKNADGSANVIMMGEAGTQVIPAKASEVSLFFRQVAQTSPFSDLKSTIQTSPGRTTNAANSRFTPGSGSNAVNAKISGYQIAALKGSGLESKVRIDVEGSMDNIGDPMYDRYTVIMYVPDPKTGMWKGDYVSGGYVKESDVLDIIGKIGPRSVNEAIKTFK